MNEPRSLPYFGGKSRIGAIQQTGRWIASLLPRRDGYCEPFAGMLGVLLQREPSKIEIACDADERIITWWRVVRDDYEALSELVNLTPRSNKEFEFQLTQLGHPDPLRKALAVHYVLTHSLHCGLGSSHYKRVWKPVNPFRKWTEYGFGALHARIRDVHLDTLDACETLERMARWSEWVIYCDPPYKGAATAKYGLDDLDRDRIQEALQAQAGAVAISGFGSEWDSLGWVKAEKQVSMSGFAQKGRTFPRTEVLWMNYQPGDGPLFSPGETQDRDLLVRGQLDA